MNNSTHKWANSLGDVPVIFHMSGVKEKYVEYLKQSFMDLTQEFIEAQVNQFFINVDGVRTNLKEICPKY